MARLAWAVALCLTIGCGEDASDGGTGGKPSTGGATNGGSGGSGNGGATGGSGGSAGATGGSAGTASGGTPSGVYPGASWQERTPEEAQLSAAGLAAFASDVGGRGVVVRGGTIVHKWGDEATRGDVASAAKPIYGYFLFRAVETGKLASIDDTVVTVTPELGTINAALGFKDKDITWRHMATQTSCYGVTEKPGTAFDYNDWQMALFWDSLFLKVWGASYSNVDDSVLSPELCDPLECEDDPTFLAFGEDDRAGRVAISPRDFARFGLLFLRGGTWKGTALLPSSVVATIVGSSLPNSIPQTAGNEAEMIAGQRSIGSNQKPDNQGDHLGSYSFMWWTNGVDRDGNRHWKDAPLDIFAALGHGGKEGCVVIPSLDLIASWNESSIDTREEQNQALAALAAAAQ